MRRLYRDMLIVTRGNWEAESGELFSAVTPISPGVFRAFGKPACLLGVVAVGRWLNSLCHSVDLVSFSNSWKSELL